MALDKLVDSSQLDNALLATANAIRNKTRESEALTWNMNTGFSVAIGDIVTLEEGTDDANATANDMLDGKTAYVKGAKVTGNILTKTSSNLTVSENTVTVPSGYYAINASADVPEGTITSSSANISSVSVDYNSTNDNFSVSGSSSISAPTVNTAGYVSSTKGTKNGNTATLSASVPKIAGSVSFSGTNGFKPTIQKTTTPSGVTNAASGDATTTEPSSGVYVAVESQSNSGSVTATPLISRNGYGTSVYNGLTGNTKEITLSASDTTYVPIKTGKTTQNAPTVNASGLVTATSTVTEGYQVAGTKSNTLQLTTKGTATITPGTTNQEINAGTYIIGKQTILGDADLIASNIKKNVEIFGVTGTFTTTPSGKTALTAAALRSGYAGFINGTQVNGSMPDTTVTEGTTTTSSTAANRGTWSQTAGYTESRIISAATFANEATNGKTYVDISSTTSAPVLIAGDYLYINKGWTDDLKISLAKLIPDGSDVKGHGEYLLLGHSAYDNDGTLVAGTIPTLASTDLVVNGKTVIVPLGKYTGAEGATAVSVNVADGAYSASVSSHSVTTTPVVTGSLSGTVTDIGTTTQPSSGTDGTDYWTITPSGSVTTTGVSTAKGKATIGTAGYIATGNKESTASTVNITPTVTNGSARYLTKAVITGSSTNATATTTVTPGTVSIANNTTEVSGKTRIDSGVTTATTGIDTYYMAIKATAAANSTGTNSSISGSGSATVSTAGYAPTTLTGNINVSGTATAKTSAKDSSVYYIPLPSAAISASGTASATTTVAPGTVSITKQNVPSGVTQAASGNATTTVPSSGVYVAVKATAAANNTGTTSSISGTANATCETAGWADTTLTGTGSITGTATAKTSAKDSSITYVPITTVTPSFDGGSMSGTAIANSSNATLSDSTNNSGIAIVTSCTATRDSVNYYGSVNGWVTKANGDTALASTAESLTSKTYYVNGVTVPADKTFIVAGTGTTQWQPTAKNVGILKAYGYYGNTLEGPKTIVYNGAWANTNVGSAGTYYGRVVVGTGAYSASVSSHSIAITPVVTGALSGTITSIGTTTQPSGTDGADYWTITPSGTVTTTGQSASKGKATIGTAGYLGTGSVESSASTADIIPSVVDGSDRYIVKAAITGSSTNATATTTVAPGTVSISKQNVPSGVTQAASGNATTTAPSSGVYVAVKATAAANSTGTTSAISGSGSATVTTAGYAPSNLTGSISVSGTATAKTSAKDSSVTYVPITTASPAFDGGTLSGSSTAAGTNVTLSTTDNGMKIQTAYTAASTAVLYNGAVNGWVTKADNAQALAAQSKSSTNGTAYYVTAVTMPKDKGFTVTTTADTELDTTSDLDVTNNAYRRVDITNNANGTVLVANSGNTTVASGSATAGNLTVSAYNSSGTAENDKSIVSAGKWVATNVTSSGTYYGRVTIGAGAYSASVSSHSVTTTPVVTGSISGTITDIGTTTKPSGTDGTNYWTITPNGSVTTTGVSTATGKATISTAGYLAAANKESSASTVNITPTVSNGTELYIIKGAITNNTSGGTSTATVNRGKQIKIGAGYYPSDLYYTAQANSGTKTITSSGTISVDGYANISLAAATFTNNTTGGTSSGTILRGKQLKISKGYLSADTYYTAQANSGTLTINASGTTSCDGYANVSVASATITTALTTYNMSTYFNSGSASDNSIQIVPTYTNNAGYATTHNATNNGGTEYYKIKNAYPTFSSAPTGGSTATSSNASISNSTNSSGVSIQTQYSVAAAPISYAVATTGWVDKPASATTGSWTTAKSATNGTLYYINGITMATPTSGTRTFTVTAPSGGTNHTYTFTQDADGRTSIKVDNTLTMQWNDSTESLDFIYT